MPVKEVLVKSYKDKVLIGTLLLGLIISVCANVKQSYDKEVLEMEIAVLKSELSTSKVALVKHKEARPAVVSCANNQADYINALINMEKEYKMPNGILQNIAYHESRYNPNAVSHAGAVGIMQIHPRWHKGVNAYDPYESIKYGAKYLQSLHDRFGNWEMALAAWNWGQGNLSKYSIKKAPRETRNFIKNVMTGVVV